MRISANLNQKSHSILLRVSGVRKERERKTEVLLKSRRDWEEIPSNLLNFFISLNPPQFYSFFFTVQAQLPEEPV